MFSLRSMVQPPVTVPLRHLIHAFRSPKSTSVSVSASVSQNQHRDVVPEHEAPSNEPVLNLRGLGLSELKIGQIDQLVDSRLPGLCKGKNISPHWHTCVSHFSALDNALICPGHFDMPATYSSKARCARSNRNFEMVAQ
uniref:Uncharacterized protein n=1 Tax=Rhinolophus ferrumequinum TaxID=59479 RepID=A0A671EP63_RHIFE